MEALSCPQLHAQSASVQLSAATGMWWNVPPVPEWLSLRIRVLAHLPLIAGRVHEATSYPGGHALRWSFLGLLVCWLCWRHIQRLALRIPLLLLALLAAIGGGFIQWYIGAHLITDTIAGYLLGMAAACCTIGILLLYEKPQEASEARTARVLETT
jgi:membrane-associated phospholipid phosphatase